MESNNMSKEIEYHLLPFDDTDPHEDSKDCKCNPEVIHIDENSCLIVHNSFFDKDKVLSFKEKINYN